MQSWFPIIRFMVLTTMRASRAGPVTPYDDFPYPGYPHAEAHPSRLAAIGRLRGMLPQNVEACRVLELGCGDGTHLIMLAEQFPGSVFIGVDTSASIDKGRALIAALPLDNIRLYRMDVRDVAAQFGTFDYVVAEGVYSWVPQMIRRRILAICNQVLTPHGLAYVSYCTHPGYYPRLAVRDMLLFNKASAGRSNSVLRDARSFLAFMVNAGRGHPYCSAMEEVIKSNDEAIIHDDMADVNEPCYVSQFLHDAKDNNLQHIADATLSDSLERDLPDWVQEELATLSNGNREVKMQYRDFVVSESFRRSILCRREQAIELRPHRLQRDDIYIVRCRKKTGGGEVPVSGCRDGSQRDRRAMDIIDYLNRRYPNAMSSRDLQNHVFGLGNENVASDDDGRLFLELIEYLAAKECVELFTVPPRFTTAPAERPTARRMARLQAQLGAALIPTFTHTVVRLDDPLLRDVLQLCDGNRTRRQICENLLETRMQSAEARGDSTSAINRDVDAIAKDVDAALLILTAWCLIRE
jgi:SAM-dependent methyltransferase